MAQERIKIKELKPKWDEENLKIIFFKVKEDGNRKRLLQLDDCTPEAFAPVKPGGYISGDFQLDGKYWHVKNWQYKEGGEIMIPKTSPEQTAEYNHKLQQMQTDIAEIKRRFVNAYPENKESAVQTMHSWIRKFEITVDDLGII